MAAQDAPLAPAVGLGIAASMGGTALMTAFQRLVEMPLTGRKASYAPADFAQTILRIRPRTRRGRRRLNAVTHFALGGMWGSAFGLAAHLGLRGIAAVPPVFAAVYTADGLVNTALGIYEPTSWSAKDLAVDVGSKLLQATATALLLDRLLAAAKRR